MSALQVMYSASAVVYRLITSLTCCSLSGRACRQLGGGADRHCLLLERFRL